MVSTTTNTSKYYLGSRISSCSLYEAIGLSLLGIKQDFKTLYSSKTSRHFTPNDVGQQLVHTNVHNSTRYVLGRASDKIRPLYASL